MISSKNMINHICSVDKARIFWLSPDFSKSFALCIVPISIKPQRTDNERYISSRSLSVNSICLLAVSQKF